MKVRLLEAQRMVLEELHAAEAKHPEFPTDQVHAVAIMVEEAGESMRAVLQYVYEGGSLASLKKELAQTGAMVLRVMTHLPEEKTP